MGREGTPFGLAKGERQAMKQMRRSEPDVLVAGGGHFRLKGLGVPETNQAVRAVRAHEQIGRRQPQDVGDVGVKPQVDAECLRAALKDLQERDARDP